MKFSSVSFCSTESEEADGVSTFSTTLSSLVTSLAPSPGSDFPAIAHVADDQDRDDFSSGRAPLC